MEDGVGMMMDQGGSRWMTAPGVSMEDAIGAAMDHGFDVAIGDGVGW